MWIELRGLLIDKSLSNLGIDAPEQEVEIKMSINTDHLEGYRQILDDDGTVYNDETLIYLKGNGSFVIKHGYEEFKKLINDSKII